MAAVVLSLFVATPASTQQVAPDGCDTVDRRIDLYAEIIGGAAPTTTAPIGYGLAPGQATRPGPLMEMVEGECLAITVHNDIPVAAHNNPSDGQPLGISLHTHGVKYTIESDGTSHSDSIVPPGGERTYIWYAAPREIRGREVLSNGTAGYWWYHDHNLGTEHGANGQDRGLAGALVVRRPGDPQPDRTYTTNFNRNSQLNYTTYPSTDTCDPMNPVASNTCFIAEEGELIEFVNFATGEFFHTWHLHGHNWADTRTGIPSTDRRDDPMLIDNQIMAAGDSFGFMIRAGDKVGAGSWMLHCHIESHASLGMWSFFHVLDENGHIPMGEGMQHMTPGLQNLADEGAEAAPAEAAPAAEAPVASAAPAGGRDDSIRRDPRG